MRSQALRLAKPTITFRPPQTPWISCLPCRNRSRALSSWRESRKAETVSGGDVAVDEAAFLDGSALSKPANTGTSENTQKNSEINADPQEYRKRSAMSGGLNQHVQSKSGPAGRTQKEFGATKTMLMVRLAALREDLAVAKRIILETLVVSDIPVPNSAEGVVKIIQLNRPQQRNSLSSQLIAELASQISAIHSEGDRGKTRAVILASTSAGTFCSGSDMKERQSMNDGEVNTFLSKARDTFTRITQLPVPVIAALNGHVLGGGMELALTAHIRYLASNLTMAFPETKSMGIIPGLGGTYRLPQIVARNQALELILTNRKIKVGKATYLGLGTYEPAWGKEEKALDLDEAGQHEACLARALRTAKDIAQAAPLATRAVLAAMVSKERPEGEIEENMAYESLLGTQDRKEALTAFVEKRKPVFTGR